MDSVRYEEIPADAPPYIDHQGPHRQYIRDIILGVNDGLVSIFLLVVGVVGGGLTSRQIVLASVAAAVAGAISMASGEYIATKSQEEVFEGEMELEREHLKYHRPHERNELREWFSEMGLEPSLVEEVVAALDQDDDQMMRVMMALEFGVVESERRSPIAAMLASGGLFLLGSIPSIVPFVLVDSPTAALAWAAVASGIALFAVGVAKTYATRKNPLRSGLENLAIAAAGAVLSYIIGSAFEGFVA